MGFDMGERVICQVLHAYLFLIYKKWKSFSATSLTDKRNHDLHSTRLGRKFYYMKKKEKNPVFIKNKLEGKKKTKQKVFIRGFLITQLFPLIRDGLVVINFNSI